MKTKFLLIATAALCLAACNKQEIIDGPDDHGKEGDYMIEIAELDQPTKSSPSTVELNLADLVSPSSKNITAQLKKRSGSGWANVDNGVTYSWSATSEDNQKFSGSGTVNQSCNVSAKKAGTGNITVSAAISGTTVATQPVPVKVSDDRALSWTNATTSLTAGEVKTAVLNSNFSGTASISSNNSSFLVGTSENSLNTTTSVTFGTKKSQTIYYKYTGSSQTTVKMNASSGSISSSQSIGVKQAVTLSSISLSFSSNSVYAGGSVTAKVTAKYSDGTTSDVTSQSTITGSSKLSVSGSTVSSIKAIGCLGEQSVSASYDGKNASASLTVVTDFKSVSLTCELTCLDNWASASGDGSRDIYLSVPMNDGGEVKAVVYGTLTTYNGDSYDITNNSLIKIWYENDLFKNGQSTDYMMPGDDMTFRIEYLGQTVKSWIVHY